MELNTNFNEPKSKILTTRIMWNKKRVLFRHIDSMSKKSMFSTSRASHKLQNGLSGFSTSHERATQKCKNEKQRFESGTIWSMLVLTRYYF